MSSTAEDNFDLYGEDAVPMNESEVRERVFTPFARG